MKSLKRKLAIILTAALLAGLLAVPSFADEAQGKKMGWYLEEGDWHFYDSQGKQAIKKLKMVNEKWYGFDENGRMYCDELFSNPKAVPGSPESEKMYYAYPDGHLATDWVKLDPDGHLYDSDNRGEGEICWYYFKEDSEGLGEMVKGVELTMKEKDETRTYAFHEDGKMFSREWAYLHTEKGKKVPVSIDEPYASGEELAYYQFEGDKAVDKWLPLDWYWYLFDEGGNAKRAIPTASPSNAVEEPVGGVPLEENSMAPGRQVSSIEFIGDPEVEVAPGESVELKFKVNLASDSNAKENGFRKSRHDAWGSANKNGKFHVKFNEADLTCTATYTPNRAREEQIQLYIDGVESDVVMISVKLETAKEQEKAASDILNSWEEEGYKPSQVKEDIENIYSSATTEEQKKNLQSTLLKNENFEKLASTYATANRIEESVSVKEEALKLLGGTVSLTGGALNAEEESKVELKVDTAEVPELSQTFAQKIAFDITMDIDGESQSELNIPVRITMPVPAGYSAAKLELFHIHNGVESEVEFVTSVQGGVEMISFMADRFSTFVFAQKDNGDDNKDDGKDDVKDNNNDDDDDNGSSSSSGSSSQSKGVTTTDAKKGQINSLTGIITGSGNGYSNWQQEQAADGGTIWKLRYADGTYAAGSVMTREDGTTYEQPAWEMINGSWYAFGADGYAKGGFVYDEALGGYFYIDINVGMKTGWTQLDGKWYYFHTISDGKKGILYVDTLVDGWYVDADGVWDGQAKK